MHAVLLGFGLGFLVAVQLGPMSLFLIRSTLRQGWAVGLAIGAGIAVIDGVYATLGAAGAVPLLTIGPLRVVLGLVGAAVLVVLGLRTLWSAFRVRTRRRARVRGLRPPPRVPDVARRHGLEPGSRSRRGRRSSPQPAPARGDRPAPRRWSWRASRSAAPPGWACSRARTAIVRRAVGPRAIRAADAIAGLGLLGFGGALAYGAVHDR